MNQRRGSYTPHFRQQMMVLVGIGRKPIELAKEFGCHESSISAWVRQAQADALGGGKPVAPMTTAERQELAQLRRQVRQITQERDRSGSTNLNSEISGNSDVFGLTNMVGQEGVFHGQAKKESQRRTACTQAAHKRIQSPSRLGGAA